MTIKVLHIFGQMEYGGAEIRTLELAERLNDSDIIFDYLTLTGKPGALDQRIASLGGTVIPCPLTLSLPIRLYRVLRDGGYDVLDSHVATASGLFTLVAALAKVPTRIAHFRSDSDGRPNNLRRRIQRTLGVALIDATATDVIGVSPSTLTDGYRDAWEKSDKTAVIPNGFSPASERPAAPRARSFNLICVGRPSIEKHRERSIAVAAEINARGVDASVTIVGPHGDDAAAIESAIAKHGMESKVSLLGSRSDVRQLLANSDVTIVASTREGLPGVVLESLSVGTPVVATPLPGTAWIADSVLGVSILDSRESDASWADRALSIAHASDRRQIRRRFESSIFSSNSTDDAMVAVYRGIHA